MALPMCPNYMDTTTSNPPSMLQRWSPPACQRTMVRPWHVLLCSIGGLTHQDNSTNGTSAFPVWFFHNMQYVFVAYIYNLNTILVRAIPFKNDGAMIAVFTDILANLNARGYAPMHNIIDNEKPKYPYGHPPCLTPQSLGQCCRMHNCNFQIAFYFCPCHSWQELPAPTLGWFPPPSGTDPEPNTILPTGSNKISQWRSNWQIWLQQKSLWCHWALKGWCTMIRQSAPVGPRMAPKLFTLAWH